jgi:hypothetical protein
MLIDTSSPNHYIRARICVPKEHEDALYGVLTCARGAITFVDFSEALLETGVSDEFVILYNAFYHGTVCQLDTELPYDLPSQTVREFIDYIELCTDGKVEWLVLAYAEIRGWSNFSKIEAAIEADPVLKNCASIERML